MILDGPGWTVREALGESWRWYVTAGDDSTRSRPATVPGSVVTDLWRAGELPDPYHDRNTRAAEWTGARSWIYRRWVELPELGPDEWATVELDGVDPSGHLFWDGQQLGRIEGLYHRGRFAIPRDATAGRHRLDVVVDPVPASQPQVGRTDAVRVHRPRMNEGWDFCPRFPHQGIWRSVRVVTGSAQLADAAARTELDADGTGRVLVHATVETGAESVPVRIRVRDTEGAVVAERRERAHPGVSRFELTVARPELWWPRGYGRPATYRLELDLEGGPSWQRTIGFRRAQLVRNAGAPAASLGYTAVVNDTVVPLLGWNWVPVDAQYGAVEPERIRHLVQLAADSGARLLRVWGGGLAETEEFYDACDRAGLLVWQEFSQSSSGIQSAPADDSEFVALMVGEAAVVVPARTHHPALLAWDAGNELAADGAALDEQHSPVVAALRDAVAHLDPGRAWLPTSPSGPDGHDRHGPWEHQGLRGQAEHYNRTGSLAHTEFGVEGMTNRRALSRLIPPEHRWPADRGSPSYQHLGDWWNNAELVQQSFGHRLHDLDSLRRASQLLQATGLGYAVEADRRRFPSCSMVLPWQLGESYPNAWCTSCVDHSGAPKPAYHAVARAFLPARATLMVPTSVWAGEAELRAEVWLWSEAGTPPGSRVLARLRAADGAVLTEQRWDVAEPVGDPRPVGTLAATGAGPDAVVAWEVTWQSADGELLDREVVLACTGGDFAPLLDLDRATLDVAARPGASGAADGGTADGGWTVEVAHRGGPLVVGLQLVDDRPPDATGWVVPEGDPRPLLPGEVRSFAVRGSQLPAPPQLLLESWNTAPVHLDLAEEHAT